MATSIAGPASPIAILIVATLLLIGGYVVCRWRHRTLAAEHARIKERLATESSNRTAAEQDASATQQLLDATFDAVDDLVVVVDRRMRVIKSNWKGMEHVPPETRETNPICYACLYGRESACEKCPAETIFETGESQTFEQVSPAGDKLYEISVFPIKNKEGEIIFAVQHVRDITQRRMSEDALHQSETQLRHLVQNVPMVMWSLDPKGVFTMHKGKGLEKLGLEQDAQVGESLFDLYEDVPAITGAARRALDGEEFSARIEHGGMMFEIRYSPIYNAQEEFLGAVGLAMDVTERVRAEEETERTKLLLESHLQNSPLGIVEWDKEFQVARWSGNAPAIFGWTADEVLGKRPDEMGIVYHEDQEVVDQFINENLLSGETVHSIFRNRNVTKEGEVICCDWHNSILFDEEGQIVSILSLVEDVTEVYKAQLAMERSNDFLEETVQRRTNELQHAVRDMSLAKRRMETILASVADGLVVTDNENRILSLNIAAEAILGLHPGVLGQQLDHVIENRSLREALSNNINKANAYDSYQFDFTVPGQHQGPAKFIQARTAVIRDTPGAPQGGVVISLRDITVEKEVDRMKSEFISTAAHELRTPLTTIQGFSEILLTREGIGQVQKGRYLRMINAHAQALAGIITDLLDISRIESGRGFSFLMRPFDLLPVIHAKVEEYTETARGHTIRFDADAASLTMEGDAGKIEQMLENLLSNAVKYSPEGGEITVSMSHDKDYAYLHIADQGMGMTEEQIRRVYEKFYRAHSSDGAIPGTGLGMSIVKHIVEAHSGHITIESVPHQGTTIHLKFLLRQVGHDGFSQQQPKLAPAEERSMA